MTDQTYVAGFLFCAGHVLLVFKQRPEWQRNLWNGVGGKVEPGEDPDLAMRREFREETGIDRPDWRIVAWEMGPGYRVAFYSSVTHSQPDVPDCNDVGEKLRWWPVRGLDNQIAMVGNCRWLIPLAQDWRKRTTFANVPTFDFADDITRRPTW